MGKVTKVEKDALDVLEAYEKGYVAGLRAGRFEAAGVVRRLKEKVGAGGDRVRGDTMRMVLDAIGDDELGYVDIVDRTGLSRASVATRLRRLEGAGEVVSRVETPGEVAARTTSLTFGSQPRLLWRATGKCGRHTP